MCLTDKTKEKFLDQNSTSLIQNWQELAQMVCLFIRSKKTNKKCREALANRFVFSQHFVRALAVCRVYNRTEPRELSHFLFVNYF